MRLLIAGSRTLSPTIAEIDAAVAGLASDLGFDPDGPIGWIDMVISGRAPGTDMAGEAWAHVRLCGQTCRNVPRISSESCGSVIRMPARWERYGRYLAGRIRNGEMARACDCAVIFRGDGISNGTDDMIEKMNELGKPTHIVRSAGAR